MAALPIFGWLSSLVRVLDLHIEESLQTHTPNVIHNKPTTTPPPREKKKKKKKKSSGEEQEEEARRRTKIRGERV